MLAETSTTDISKEEKPTTFEENQSIARRGGRVAGIARQAQEAETGKPVITSQNTMDFAKLIDDVVKEVEQPKKDGENNSNDVLGITDTLYEQQRMPFPARTTFSAVFFM